MQRRPCERPSVGGSVTQRTLPELPYKKNALEPYIGELTLDVHYEQYHRGYLEKLVQLLEGKPEASESLEDLICTSTDEVYLYAAQVWNHSFSWRSLKPGGRQPRGQLLARIEGAFGGFAHLRQILADEASAHFGPGWAWLVVDGRDQLRVVSTSVAGNPMREGARPLLTIDLWEHAYYLDYLSERERYVRNVIEYLLDWDFAAENLRLSARGAPRNGPDISGRRR